MGSTLRMQPGAHLGNYLGSAKSVRFHLRIDLRVYVRVSLGIYQRMHVGVYLRICLRMHLWVYQ